MEAPDKINPTKLGDYLNVMSKSVFQSGMSWKVVNNKWPDIQEAFRGFDPEIVSEFAEPELDELTKDKRVIRHRRKLEAIVYNARTMMELDKSHDGFVNYLRSHSDFDATVDDIRKKFKYMGDTGIYVFLYIVGEEVAPHDEWFEIRRKGKVRT